MNHSRQTPIAFLALGLLLACSSKDGKSSGEQAAGAAPGLSSGSQAGGSGGTDPGAVAQVGLQPIPYRLFERYLNDNAGEETEEGEQTDAIKSRLLDQLIEEQLLLAAAPGFKIAVSDAEVDAYLGELGLTEGDLEVSAADGKEAFRERIKNGLIVQKVKEAAVLSKIQVTPGEVDDALKSGEGAPRAASQLVLRQILLDDKKVADEVRRKIEADPGQFQAVAKERSVAPDKGQPRSYAEEDLPADLREAILALQPGQVSPVMEHAQSFLIFQLVRRVEVQADGIAEVRRRIEADLRREKADQVMERYLADLKEKTEIHVNRSILPFRYVGEFRN